MCIYDRNIKAGLIVAISLIALFVLSLLVLQKPLTEDNSVRFGILSILPPLVAILAFVTKETILSLFIGVFVGEFMICIQNANIFETIINTFLSLCSHVLGSMADPWNAGIILQCLLIGGVIQLVSKMGGAKALATSLSKRAKTPSLLNLLLGF